MELLRTPRLLLRHWEEPDLPAFFDLYSREDVMRWLGPHPRRALTTLDEARERLGRWHDRERALDPPLGLWAIVPLPSGTGQRQPVGTIPAGTIPLVPLADAGGPTNLIEIGWHLHLTCTRDIRGRGSLPKQPERSSRRRQRRASTRCSP